MARWQLVDAGMTRGEIGGRIRRGFLHQVHRGVYAVGHRSLTLRSRWIAAVLTGGPTACLGHRSAAELWRLSAPRHGIAEIVVPPGIRRRNLGVLAHEAMLPPDERSVVDAIPVTSPFRTAFDLAGVVRPRELERLWNEAKARGLTDRLSPWELLRRYPGRRGAAAWRRLLESEAPEGITRSELEEAFLALLDDHGLPRPRLNAALALRGSFVEIDCLWEEERLAVELDGRAFHGTARSFEADRRRDRLLLSEGWRTIRITWRQVSDEPETIAADLRQALRLARP